MIGGIGIILIVIGIAVADSEAILIPAALIAVGLTLCKLSTSGIFAAESEAGDEEVEA